MNFLCTVVPRTPPPRLCEVIGMMIKWTDSFEQTKLSFSPQPVPAISSVGGKWGSIFNRTFKPEMFHAAAKLCIYQTQLKHLLKVITVSNEVCRMCAETWEGFVSPSLPIEITHVCVRPPHPPPAFPSLLQQVSVCKMPPGLVENSCSNDRKAM